MHSEQPCAVAAAKTIETGKAIKCRSEQSLANWAFEAVLWLGGREPRHHSVKSLLAVKSRVRHSYVGSTPKKGHNSVMRVLPPRVHSVGSSAAPAVKIIQTVKTGKLVNAYGDRRDSVSLLYMCEYMFACMRQCLPARSSRLYDCLLACLLGHAVLCCVVRFRCCIRACRMWLCVCECVCGGV